MVINKMNVSSVLSYNKIVTAYVQVIILFFMSNEIAKLLNVFTLTLWGLMGETLKGERI